MSVRENEKRSCSRCHGFMVSVILDGSEEVMSGLRCVNCGECIDSLILANRHVSRQDVIISQRPCLP